MLYADFATNWLYVPPVGGRTAVENERHHSDESAFRRLCSQQGLTQFFEHRKFLDGVLFFS